jgi:DNA repair protein RadC
MKVQKHRLELVAERDGSYNWDARRALSSPSDVAAWAHEVGMTTSPQEQMTAIYVDTRNRPVGWSLLFVGMLNRMAVEPRPILQTGLLLNATKFFLIHNHPSGDPSPSPEDIAFTKKLAQAAEVVGLTLLDHVVVGDGYFSMRGKAII